MQESTTYLIIIGAVVVALAALAALANYALSIVRSFQTMRHEENPPRNPPLPEEVAKAYATKRELAELKDELRAERRRVDGIFEEQFKSLSKLSEKITQWQLGIERLIGRIEGKVNGK